MRCARAFAAYPQISLRVDLCDAFVDLVEAGYDLALREGQSDLPGLIARVVGRNRLALCASPAYLARKGVPTLADLDRHDWLAYRHPALSRQYWWVECDGQRTRLAQPAAPRLESDNYDLLLANALAGVGVLHTPLWSAAPYIADGRLVRLLADHEIDPDAFGDQILAVYPSHRRATGKVLAFIDYLAAFLEARGWPERRDPSVASGPAGADAGELFRAGLAKLRLPNSQLSVPHGAAMAGRRYRATDPRWFRRLP